MVNHCLCLLIKFNYWIFACNWFGLMSIDYATMFVAWKGKNQCSPIENLFWENVDVVKLSENHEYLNCNCNNMPTFDEFIELSNLQSKFSSFLLRWHNEIHIMYIINFILNDGYFTIAFLFWNIPNSSNPLWPISFRILVLQYSSPCVTILIHFYKKNTIYTNFLKLRSKLIWSPIHVFSFV